MKLRRSYRCVFIIKFFSSVLLILNGMYVSNNASAVFFNTNFVLLYYKLIAIAES